MSDNDILVVLKIDLEIANTKQDSYLLTLITTARDFIGREGISLSSTSHEDGMLVEMYAAYIYRQRRESGAGSEMPRMLRWELNNRIYGKEASTSG